jgi:hypothetical protein
MLIPRTRFNLILLHLLYVRLESICVIEIMTPILASKRRLKTFIKQCEQPLEQLRKIHSRLQYYL